MAFQYPVAIPGVTVAKYLRMALNAHREARGEPRDQAQGLPQARPRRRWSWSTSRRSSPAATSTTASPAARRSGWRSCSWRCCSREMAVLDETDSGLDIDALRVVAEGVNRFAGPEMGVLIITHYQRILHLVEPDRVHVMFEGRIVKEGGPELVDRARGEGLRLDPRGGRGGGVMQPRRATRPRLPDREGPRGLPGARARGQRQAGRLPRLRRQLAAGARLDPGGRPLRAPPPLQRPPRLAHALGRGDRRLRGRPGDRRRPHRRRRPPRGRLRPQRDRGDQPRRPRLGRRQRRRRRPDRAHRDGAPLEHRPLAAARRARRRRDRLGPGHRRRACSTSTRYAALLERGPKLVAVAHVSNVLGTQNPLAEISRLAHDAGALVLADGAQAAPKLAARRGRARRRLLRDHRPQGLRRRPGSARSGRGSTCCARCRRSSAAAR